MSTGVVMAAARRAERRLIDHFRAAGALDPSSARPAPDPGWMDGRAFRRLVAAGALRAAGAGYYLDEAAYAAHRSWRMRKTALILVPLTVAAMLVIWWSTTR